MTTELVKLLPDGANVVAVIIVVVMFLKQQDKFNGNLKQTIDDFHGQVRENQKNFQEQIASLSSQYFTNQSLYQAQIQRLMDSHIAITKEVITTLEGLKQNVNLINEKILERDRAQLPDRRNPT